MSQFVQSLLENRYQTPNHASSVRSLSQRLLLVLFVMVMPLLSCAQTSSTDVNWLIDVLQLSEGSVVADIGAGDGDQTLAVAQFIGESGRIYSTELGALDELRESVQNSELENITVVKSHPVRTNLPEDCCDAMYMRRVYHHIDNPMQFNTSLYHSLKPGGRLAIIDFEPRGSEAEPEGRDSGNQHGVTVETVIKELNEAGFDLVNSEKPSGRYYYIVFQKPKE